MRNFIRNLVQRLARFAREWLPDFSYIVLLFFSVSVFTALCFALVPLAFNRIVEILEWPKFSYTLLLGGFWLISVFLMALYFLPSWLVREVAGRIWRNRFLLVLIVLEVCLVVVVRWWTIPISVVLPALIYVAIYVLARQDLFFTLLTPGRIKVVGRFTRGLPNSGVPVRFLSVHPYYVDSMGNVTYDDAQRNLGPVRQVWEALFGGIGWVGIYPIYQVMILQLSFAELKGQQIVKTEGVRFNFIYAKGFQYAVEIIDAETSDRLKISNITLLVPLIPRNCLRLLTKGPMDWVDAALTLITAAMPSIVAGHTAEEVMALRSAASDQTIQRTFNNWLNDSPAFQNAKVVLRERGLDTYSDILSFSLTPPPEYQEIMTRQLVAKQNAAALAQAAKGQESQMVTVGNAFAGLTPEAQRLFVLKQLGETMAGIGGGAEGAAIGGGLTGQLATLMVTMKILKDSGIM